MNNILFVELHVPKQVSGSICIHSTEVVGIFREAVQEMEYGDVALTVLPFSFSTEKAVIKVSDPHLRSWTGGLRDCVQQAWGKTAELLAIEIGNIGEPKVLFSTAIP